MVAASPGKNKRQKYNQSVIFFTTDNYVSKMLIPKQKQTKKLPLTIYHNLH